MVFALIDKPLAIPVFDISAIIYLEGISMPAVTIRNLSDETHRALRLRAAHHGPSTEAEIREIIEAAVRPPERVSSALYWRLLVATLSFAIAR